MAKIEVKKKVLSVNDEIAEGNRAVFRRNGVRVVNILSSPGAGKTTLLERTLENLGDQTRVGVVEGDVQTRRDADRLERFDCPVVQVNTGGGCHLNAKMIQEALKNFDLASLNLLLIENVGNLVCPSAFDLGEAEKVVILSTPEGDDKVMKYPRAFIESSALVINKVDLLPILRYDVEKVRREATTLNAQIEIMELSALTGEGVDRWVEWLRRSQ